MWYSLFISQKRIRRHVSRRGESPSTFTRGIPELSARRMSRAMLKEGAIVLYRASSRDSSRLLAGKKPAGAHIRRGSPASRVSNNVKRMPALEHNAAIVRTSLGLPLPPRIVRVSHCFQARVARRRASGRINARETARARPLHESSRLSDLEASERWN